MKKNNYFTFIILLAGLCIIVPGCDVTDENGKEVYSDGNEWARTFGGQYNDGGHYVQETSDGGYIIAADRHIVSEDICQIAVIKTDSDGNKEWEIDFPPPINFIGNMHCFCVQQTNEGGYICTGSYPFEFEEGVWTSHAWLGKLNSSGGVEWTHTYGTYNESVRTANARSVAQTDDGGYIVVGTIRSGSRRYQIYVIKTDSHGTVEWTNTFGYTGFSNDRSAGYSVIQTADGNYVISGIHEQGRYGGAPPEGYILKIDKNGESLWQNYGHFTYTGGITEEGEYYSLCEYFSPSDEMYHYVIAGRHWLYSRYREYGKGESFLMCHYRASDGRQLSSYDYLEPDCESKSLSVNTTASGGFVIAGRIQEHDVDHSDAYAIGVDSSGTTLWTRRFGGSEGSESFRSIQQTSDGGYIAVGSTSSYGSGGSDIFLVKFE